MSIKNIVFFAQVLLVQNILGQCIGNFGSSYIGNNGMENWEGVAGRGYYDVANSCGCSNAQWPRAQLGLSDNYGLNAAGFGGKLDVQSSSPIAPGSVSIISENQIQGPLSVIGTLPFLSAVALEGALPTQGSGAVSYQCGDGRVAMLEENYSASGYDYLDSGIFGETSNGLGNGWTLAGSGFNGINNWVASRPNIVGRNANSGFGCGCKY